MKNKVLDTVEYKAKIIDMPLSQIETNDLNPRKRFVDTEEDILMNPLHSSIVI